MNATDASSQTESEIDRWTREFFATIDRMDAAGFGRHFAADGRFRFANQPTVTGPESIAAGAGFIFGVLESIRHEMLKRWVAADDVLVEGLVHYRRAADGQTFSFPFLSVFEFSEQRPGPIQEYRVFVDSHELFLPPAS